MDKVLIGAIRWDAWHTPARMVENREQGGAVKAVERSLSPQRYHFRVPFFGKIISDSMIKIDGYTQQIMDQEIEFAKQGGLDYWAFLLYNPENSMSQGLSLYLSSKMRNHINYCAIAQPGNFSDDEGSGNGKSRLLKLIKEPGYQKVIENRPIIYIFRPEDAWVEKVGGTEEARQIIDAFRLESVKANCGNPYLVVMHFNIEHAKKMAAVLGAEAISDYAIWGDGGLNGTPYRELTTATRNVWIKSEAIGAQVVPLVMTGWDRRPRIERPVPWETGDLYPPKSYFLHRHTGELCGSVFWVKLNQRFHLLHPEDERYITEIEKSIYNVAIANQIGTKGIRYYNVLVDHKDTDHFPYSHCMNTCCEGQGTRLFGSLPEYIYSIADDGIFVNLFAASKIKYALHADSMQLNMVTKFPYDPQVRMEVGTGKPLQAKIRIRIPSWAAKAMPVFVNGKKAITGKPGTYATLLREWKTGDVISFELPMSFRTTRYEGAEAKYNDGMHYALEYGPLLMAAFNLNNTQKGVKINAKPEKLLKSIIALPGKPLQFKIKGDEEIHYRPYFEIQDEPFTCYPALTSLSDH